MTTTLSSLSGTMFKSRKYYIDDYTDYKEILSLVRTHTVNAGAYKVLSDYYRGKHIILGRDFDDTSKPNNKLIHNFPKLIVDNSVSYFVGKPISYTGKDKALLDKLQEIYDRNNSQTVDSELAKLSAEFGHSFEVFWIDKLGEIRFKAISPENMIMCYSNDIEEIPLCAIYYKTVLDTVSHETLYNCTVYTDKEVIHFTGNGREVIGQPTITPHYFGTVPVNEYIANEERTGDFECVLSLIDAYNLSCSDSVNDINYLNDAYLMLRNLISTDKEDIDDMKNNRVMLVDGDGDAQWLVKNINDLHIENIKKRLVEDIHKFSMTPNISDEKFASNLSGVAISYKLNSLESKTAVKERYFSIALRRRIEIITNILNKEDSVGYRPHEIYPTFTRNIAQNLSEIVQTVVSLQDIVPNEELLPLLDFIDDPEEAMRLLDQEREKNLERGYGEFNLGFNNVSEGNKQFREEDTKDIQTSQEG